MEKRNLIVGLSCMDLADSDEKAEENYAKVYKPFLKKLNNFPDIKIVFHCSGKLIEWFEKRHPELIMFLEELVKKRQLEMIGGGYYEPVLPIISPQDKTGQLEALTTLIRKKTGKKPQGCWIPYSVWDNSLVIPIKTCGMEYVFLDSNILAGSVTDEDQFIPFITEDNGRVIFVFPVHSWLASFEKQKDILNYGSNTKSFYEDKNKVLSLIFSEKDIVKRDETWIENLFAEMVENKSLKIITPASYIKNNYPAKKRYVQNIIKYKNILSENYEVNLIYARMIHVQTHISQIKGDKYKKNSAATLLWEGQSYLPYINFKENNVAAIRKSRYKTYKNFIDAELMAKQKDVFIPFLFKYDFDLDGIDEFLYYGENYNIFIHDLSASVFEFDCFKSSWNYCDATDFLWNKESFKNSFTDYFFDSAVKIKGVKNFIETKENKIAALDYSVNKFERGENYISFLCNLEDADTKDKNGFSLKVVKNFTFKKNSFEVAYNVTNTGSKAITKKMAVGMFFSANCCNGKISTSRQDDTFFLKDEKKTITIKSGKTENIYFEDVENSGTYCYTAVLPVYNIDSLEPDSSFEFAIEVKI